MFSLFTGLTLHAIECLPACKTSSKCLGTKTYVHISILISFLSAHPAFNFSIRIFERARGERLSHGGGNLNAFRKMASFFNGLNSQAKEVRTAPAIQCR